MNRPTRVLDMHVHLFNARYLPLASIIADLLGRDPGPATRALARLLWSVTGSFFVPKAIDQLPAAVAAHSDEPFIDAIWQVTEFELREALKGGANADLVQAIQELATADFDAEGMPAVPGDPDEAFAAPGEAAADEFVVAAGPVVRRALRRMARALDPNAWEDGFRYLEFFLTMLGSEQQMVDRLIKGYGSGLPPLEVVHFMMDMQEAYPSKSPPYYPSHPDQVDRMARLGRGHPGRVAGFAAFDPRRPDWRDRCDEALDKGLLGFKFYPAMGYKPWGNADRGMQTCIEEFFAYCSDPARDVPVFAHCTPEGFQTRRKEGHFADPRYWKQALEQVPTLRLCLGHAGGGRASNGPVSSPGWSAASDGEWARDDNFARHVVDLCRTYENVYCEMGYLTDLFSSYGRAVFLANLERACEGTGAYDFLDKAIYGSDWHMPSMGDRTREYLDAFVDVFSDRRYADYRDRFFWKNGYRFLKRAVA